MPLNRYGVLAGRVIGRRSEGGTDTPHYQIHVRGGGVDFRVAANVLSQQQPSELLYIADEAFHHPMLAGLPGLPEGFTSLPSQPGGLGLDFIRANLFDRQAIRPVPQRCLGRTMTWPICSITLWNGPRLIQRPGCTPLVSVGDPSRRRRMAVPKAPRRRRGARTIRDGARESGAQHSPGYSQTALNSPLRMRQPGPRLAASTPASARTVACSA
jgi:Uncharacterized conserved protein (DUF2278)